MPISMSYAAHVVRSILHSPEELSGATAVPLAEGHVGAAVVGAEVGGDQDTLEPDEDKTCLIGVGWFFVGQLVTICRY